MLDFDDDGMRCSLVDVEYCTLPKTVVLTYQERTLRCSLTSRERSSLKEGYLNLHTGCTS